MNVDYSVLATNVIWPLTFLLVFLFVLRKVESQISPVITATVNGVAKNAGSNATAYAVAFLFGMSASLSAFIDVFHTLDSQSIRLMSYHQYAAMWAKVLNPFVVAVLAYATQNKFKGKDGQTAPPFHSDPK